MLVKRFGQTKANLPLQQWYELPDGQRINCGEQTIKLLWENWISSKNSTRNNFENFIIYEFPSPTEFLDLPQTASQIKNAMPKPIIIISSPKRDVEVQMLTKLEEDYHLVFIIDENIKHVEFSFLPERPIGTPMISKEMAEKLKSNYLP